MQSAVVHLQGSGLVRVLTSAEESTTGESHDSGHSTCGGETGVACSKDPGPILPEMKELYWGGGSFVVFALLMRFVLFPKVKKGMDARYHGIRSAHESADAERSAARAEVAEYEAQLAAIKAEAARTAARDQIHAAVSDVAGRAGELATGRKPSTAVVERVVNEVMAR